MIWWTVLYHQLRVCIRFYTARKLSSFVCSLQTLTRLNAHLQLLATFDHQGSKFYHRSSKYFSWYFHAKNWVSVGSICSYDDKVLSFEGNEWVHLKMFWIISQIQSLTKTKSKTFYQILCFEKVCLNFSLHSLVKTAFIEILFLADHA